MSTEALSGETLRCEACDADHPIEHSVAMEDCNFCPACAAKWKKHFDVCHHVWEPTTNSFGEDARYCPRCTGIVELESFPALGLEAPR